MPQYIEKPIITTFRVKIRSELKRAFADWQAKLNALITGIPGFISLEFLSESQNKWIIVQRFADSKNASVWRESEQCKVLLEELKNFSVDREIQEAETHESKLQAGVTEVIITEISPEKESSYREWSGKIHQVEATFPGFRGVYVQSPSQGKGRYWITLLQFDTSENLDRWLNSTERQEVLKESSALITSLETHRIVSPYAGWFASIAKVREVPPLWKQTMIILLVLFPIVMLEFKYLSPWTKGLDISLATFIGNAISVSLISFPMMPIAIWLLGWWLAPDAKNRVRNTLIGTFLVLLLYLIAIVIFWKFV